MTLEVKSTVARVEECVYFFFKYKNFQIMWLICQTSQFSHSVVSDSLWPHGLQHARPPCPSPTPRVYSNSCPLSRTSNHLILSHRLLFSPSIFPSIRVFSNGSALHIRWPKYWSFILIYEVKVVYWHLLLLTLKCIYLWLLYDC